jgi:hypothetical protein
VCLKPRHRNIVRRRKPDLNDGWLGDSGADLADEEAFGLEDLRRSGDQRLGDVPGDYVIYFPDVIDWILSGGGFQAHGPTRGDQTIDSVPTSDLTVIAGFGRSAVTVR